MAQIQEGGHLLMFISLLALEFVFFTSADNSEEILVSRNFSCGSVYSLSSQIDSYKIVFPQDVASSLCECPDCGGSLKKWICGLNFEVDDFILSSFELCYNPRNQEIRNCDDAHIFYDISHKHGLTTQFCGLPRHITCLGEDRKVPIIFFEYIPCGFSGYNHIFLRTRHNPTYILFKENRTCSDDGHSLEANSGRVVSEFDHHIQQWSHFCPLHIGGSEKKEYSKFCFWPEFVSFGNMATLSITVSSVDGEFELVFKRSQVREGRYCEAARPGGYIISAVVDVDDSLNDHRFRLKYQFTEKVDHNAGSDSVDDEEEEKEDDDSLPVLVVVLIGGVVALIVITGLGFYIWYVYEVERRRRLRQQESGDYTETRDPVNVPLNRPTITSSSITTTNINNVQILVSSGEVDIDSRRSPSVAPSAPMMEEREGPDVLPPAYPVREESRVLDDPPPSYDALFKTTAK